MNAPDAINVKDIYSEASKIKVGHAKVKGYNDEDDVMVRPFNRFLRSRESTNTSRHTAKTSAKSFSKRPKKSKRSKTLRLLKKRWEIPELPRLAEPHTSQYNSLDDVTIYSRHRDDRNDVLFREASPLLPPLKISTRLQEQGPDTQSIREKKLVIKYYERTGKLKQFENDRAVIPTVYPDYFECFSRKKSYINDLYIKNFIAKNKMSNECFGKDLKPVETCQYCDVIGNRYCAFCIEIKNRNFAWGYENNFIPIDAESRASIVRQSMETFGVNDRR